MSKELFDQEFGAKFSVFEGKVWNFNRELDTGQFAYDPKLPTYCSIDFGYRMPAVMFLLFFLKLFLFYPFSYNIL